VEWTTSGDIKKQVQKLWDSGKILSDLASGNSLFPRRLSFKAPTSAQLADEFGSVRRWIEDLRGNQSKGYRIVWAELNHRILGRNAVPKEIWIESLEDAIAWIDKQREVDVFRGMLRETGSRCPRLLDWLVRRPLRALEAADVWNKLLDVVHWLTNRPCPGIYLRQVDIPGVDTKFMERWRGVLTELLDLALPPQAIRPEAGGASNFNRRYGFREKPARIRFRIFEPLFPSGEDQDITVTDDVFASLRLPITRVFITENETNFLAFPRIPRGLLIFGSGYGFGMLAKARWLLECRVYYWGDIDTHGFAILDQLRILLPHAKSILMDRETLLYHRPHWGVEPLQETRDLPRLTGDEAEIYDSLRFNRIAKNLRLEQEHIAFSFVGRALQALDK
jgi:hypothetical protein